MPIALRRLARILGVLAVLGLSMTLDAARGPARSLGVLTCTFAMTNVAFGSIDVLSGAAFSTNATLTINCSGVSILPTNVFACVTFPTPLAMQGPSSQTLQYSLLGPPPATTPWSSTTPIVMPVSGSLLGFTASASVNVGATLLANQQSAPPGAYVQTVNAAVTYSTTTCTTGLIAASGGFSFQTTATIVKSCNVVAGNLDFGTVGVLATAMTAQSAIDVQCSNGVGYSIGLNGGLSGATDPTLRKMTFGAGAVTYGLYQDSGHTRPWGATIGSNVVSGTGSSVTQPYSVYGLVPAQATPAPGTYSDTIVVSVAY